VAIPSKQLDRADVRTRVLSVLEQFVTELGSGRARPLLVKQGAQAHLERDLCLGSLERVELMLRLDTEFSIRMPDRAMSEASTAEDLVEIIFRQELGGEALGAHARARAAGVAAEEPRMLALDDAATLNELLQRRAAHSPGRVHIYLYGEDSVPVPITFGELYNRAMNVAASLARRGFEPGGMVALMLPTCAEFFYCFFGILFAGGVPVPIYPPFRTDRIEEYAARQSAILKNAEVQFLLTPSGGALERIGRLLRPQVPSLKGVLRAAELAEQQPRGELPGTHLPLSRRAEDIAFLQYTSGSTGAPKGVTLTHGNLLANIRSIGQSFEIGAEDVAVSWLPLYHDMGLIGSWFVPLYFGLQLAVLSPLRFLSRPERWLWAIHNHRGTLSPAPNFAYELCVRKIQDRDIEGLDLSTWRAALNGAEPVRPETIERFSARFAKYGFRPEAMKPVYGLAEASVGVAAPAAGAGPVIDRIVREPFEEEGRAMPASDGDATALRFVSAGRALPGVKIEIRDTERNACADRQQGRLWFHSPAATIGYFRNPEATRALFDDAGWVDSGDLAYMAGEELYITGRIKDVIIKGGRNLIPHEIEEIAARVAGVRAGCVVAFGVPDERSGTEKLVVAAEVRDLRESDRIEGEIIRMVDEALGLPPDEVALLPSGSIPKTSSGKLRRADTQRLYREGKLGRGRAPAWVQVAKLSARSALPAMVARVRRGAKRAGEMIYGVYALSVAAALLGMTQLAVLATPGRMRAAREARFFSSALLKLAGVPVRIEGGELLEEFTQSGPWIFAPNHSSYVDVLVALTTLPAGVRFVAKGEVLGMPVIGTVLRRAGHFSFDRADAEARLMQAAELEAALRGGESVVIYPEGTFTAATGIRPLQMGAFKAAVATRRPICPVSVRGAREILRDETSLPRPGRVTVTFGPLITPEGNDWQEMVRLRNLLREILARNTGEPLL
jgi:fatty-acyl-CoA synthase